MNDDSIRQNLGTTTQKTVNTYRYVCILLHIKILLDNITQNYNHDNEQLD